MLSKHFTSWAISVAHFLLPSSLKLPSLLSAEYTKYQWFSSMSLWLNLEAHMQACTHSSCDLHCISRLLLGLFTIVYSVHCFHPPSQDCLFREETTVHWNWGNILCFMHCSLLYRHVLWMALGFYWTSTFMFTFTSPTGTKFWASEKLNYNNSFSCIILVCYTLSFYKKMNTEIKVSLIFAELPFCTF